MKTVILSCRTLEDELNAALEKSGVDYEVVWLESGLHNFPKKLTVRLQEELDRVEADRVLIAMGFCGNAMAGIHGDFEMILPRVDDCISLLLGSVERRMEIAREHAAYFFTEGWMRGERNIMVEYEHTLNKYGPELTESIMEMMYAHYRTLAILNSGVGDVPSLMERTREIAELLHLEQKELPATLDYLVELFTGPWSEEKYITLPAGEVLDSSLLRLNCEGAKLQ